MTTRSVPPSAPAGAVPAAAVLATRIIEDLGRDIVDGRLAEGTRLTIDDLQQRFGVSRTVVRDCVRVLEAMALGAPLVTTHEGGIADMVEPDRSALVVPAGDAAAMAAAPSRATDFESGEVRTQDDIGRARPSMSDVSGALYSM